MPVIEIVKAKCNKCGSGRRTIDINQFRKEMFNITEGTLRIWKEKKKCWVCKKTPQLGEKWGLSVNNGEKNRLYCPHCAELVENRLVTF